MAPVFSSAVFRVLRVMFVWGMLLVVYGSPAGAYDQADEAGNDQLAMIEERMRILSRGLEGMPTLPDMDEEISLPQFRIQSSEKREK